MRRAWDGAASDRALPSPDRRTLDKVFRRKACLDKVSLDRRA